MKRMNLLTVTLVLLAGMMISGSSAPLAATAQDCFSLSVRFRDNGQAAQVILELKEYNLDSGFTRTMTTFNSNFFFTSNSYQKQTIQFCDVFDFQNNAYFVEARLVKSSSQGNPGLGVIKINSAGGGSPFDQVPDGQGLSWSAVGSTGTVDEASLSRVALGGNRGGPVEIARNASSATIAVRYNILPPALLATVPGDGGGGRDGGGQKPRP